ncbi:MAG TPA: hypothetical protein VJW96_08050 [Terriglobales bacterium]|jgi:hypothetical protein|nr:hypothetical protein [Terriglobales bacterium]
MQCRWMVLGLLLAAPVLFAQSAPDQTAAPDAAPPTTPPPNSHKAQKQVVLPQLPDGPLSQLPMDQIPPTPAKVTFQGGLLTISAQNSTLGEILRDVRKLTGASIDIPPGSNGANERVVTHLGPGAPRDVLAVLLNGSSFNYVMIGSSSDPTAVSSVVLMAKPSTSGEPQTAANVYQNNPQPMPPNRLPMPPPFQRQLVAQPGNTQPAGADSDDSKDDQDTADDNADDQLQPEPPAQPDAADANAQGQQQQPDPNQPNAGPKTPEQILELLRRQQQPGGGVVPPPQQPPPQPPQQ